MNGLTGFVDNINRESYNKKSMKMDFRPDFSKKAFKNVEFDYRYMYSIPGVENESSPYDFLYDKFEFGYAITTHSSQGSSWENVLYFHEPFLTGDDNKKLLYTGITRASKSVVVVI